MSTRTTLNERIIKRTQQGKTFVGTKMHIRAELNRLARQVRKLADSHGGIGSEEWESLKEVLVLIKEVKK